MSIARRRRACGGALCTSIVFGILISFARAWAQVAPAAVTPIPHGQFPTNHGASLAVLEDGRLIACWYSGMTERGREAVILCSRADASGKEWSQPKVVVAAGEQAEGAAAPNKSVGNVVLRVSSSGDLLMLYGIVQSRLILGIETCGGWPCGRIDYKVSHDGGLTWERGKRFDDRPGALPRSHPIRYAPGVDMLPVYREGGASSVLEADLDTAGARARIAPKITDIPSRGGLIQPALARTGTGNLFAYLRDQRREGIFVSAYDSSRGAWSKATKTNLPNPDSAMEAFTDTRGRIVLVHNASAEGRRDLSISVSDDGTAFPNTCLFLAPPIKGEIAYPAVAQLGPERWGVVFSYGSKKEIGFATLTQALIDACRPGGAPH